MSTSFLYPFTVFQGKLLVTSDYPTKASNAILSAIQTHLEERVYQPEYGIDEYVFTNQITSILSDIRRSIDLGLTEYPGVTYQLYASYGDSGSLVIDINYQVNDNTYNLSYNL